MADYNTPDSKVNQIVRDFREAFRLSADFCSPHFEVAARHYALWRGKKPWQLEGTTSKIMLNTAFGICQDRAPKLKKNIFSGEDFLSLDSIHPRFDSGKDQAEAWLQNLYKDESQLNIIAEIEPTLQSVTAMGTAYRMPFARPTNDGRWQVTSRDIDFFQILPAPVGGRINPQDRNSDDCLPYYFYVDWMTNDQIKALSKYPGYQKDQAEACLASKINNVGSMDDQYREISSIIGGVNYGTGKNDWRTRLNDTERGKKNGRRRVVHWKLRDEWIIIAQDTYMIYKGLPSLGKGLLDLTRWRLTNDFSNWFGIGSLEMVEDLIIAVLMNFGYRMDHLARIMFPTKWIRDDVMGDKPESDFFDRPFAVHTFPTSVQRFSDAVVVDRIPEVSEQSFIDEDRLKGMMESVNGAPNIPDTMGKSHGIGNTATGAVGFLNQVSGRLESESMLLEYGGLAQEARLLLILADKYINDEEFIRTPKSRNGTGWMEIDSDYLTDGYIVKTHGTKNTADQEQAFQRMLALYPMWNADPMIDPYEFRRAVADASGVPNLPKVVIPPQPENVPVPSAGGSAPGGASAPQGLENRLRASRERSAVRPSGETAPANEAL